MTTLKWISHALGKVRSHLRLRVESFLSDYRRVLRPKGVLVMARDQTVRGAFGIVGRLTVALVLSRLTSQIFVTFLAKLKQEDLSALLDLMKAGKITTVVDKCYSLNQVPEAIRYPEQKRARGKVVITAA